jgi:hypothetical protein
MPQVRGGQYCRRCRERMVGRVRRASWQVGLPKVRLLALAQVQAQVGTPMVYH